MLRAILLILMGLLGASIPARADLVAGVKALLPADVILLGEIHDNHLHHLNQARVASAIRPTAIVFEMLTPEQAGRVTAANRLDKAALAAALEWKDGGWPDFSIYFPIFEAAAGAAIYGGGMPRPEVRRAVSEGAAQVFGADAVRFGLNARLPPEIRLLRENEQIEAHCNALPGDLIPGMVEAQRLRDASLARAALEALEDTGGPVLVITGNGHARRDWGIPALLMIAAPGTRVLSVGQFEPDAPESAPFDLVIVTEAVDRDDPCKVFRQQ